MSDAVVAPKSEAPAVNPPAISLQESWPWAVFALALALVIYFVGVDEGAASLIPGEKVHEWVHDGRHLLGFPCH